jgi:hypothetical protein
MSTNVVVGSVLNIDFLYSFILLIFLLQTHFSACGIILTEAEIMVRDKKNLEHRKLIHFYYCIKYFVIDKKKSGEAKMY